MGLAANNIAERAIVNAINHFKKFGAIADLDSHVETQFVLGAFADFNDLERTRDVNRDGLLEIIMLPGSDHASRWWGW